MGRFPEFKRWFSGNAKRIFKNKERARSPSVKMFFSDGTTLEEDLSTKSFDELNEFFASHGVDVTAKSKNSSGRKK